MTRQLDLFALFDDPKPAPEPPASPAPASEPEEAPLDLREALTTYASAEDVWASMAQHGASDEDIAAAIRENYYPSKAGIDAAALVPEVRAMFAIPARVLDVSALGPVELIRIAREQARAWLGSGRSPLHNRINVVIDERGEALLAAAGWPTHDGAPYINDHTRTLTCYREEIEKWVDPKHPDNGRSRADNVKYLIEHWTPVEDPAEILPAWEAQLAAALAVKRPKPSKSKKSAPPSEPYDVTKAREAVEMLKAEILRRTKER